MLRRAYDFMPFLVPHLPGATEELIWQEFLGVLVEACTEGWAYPLTRGPFDITLANEGRFDLGEEFPHWAAGPTFQVRFKGATNWGRALTPLTGPPMDLVRTGTEPTTYWLDEPLILNTFPLPEAEYPESIFMYATLTPDVLSDGMDDPNNPGTPIDLRTDLMVPDFFFTHHRQYLVAGTMATMMLMPGKPFTSNSKSEYHGRKFRSGMAKMRDYARHSWSMGEGNWKFPAFAHGGPFNGTWSDPRISPI